MNEVQKIDYNYINKYLERNYQITIDDNEWRGVDKNGVKMSFYHMQQEIKLIFGFNEDCIFHCLNKWFKINGSLFKQEFKYLMAPFSLQMGNDGWHIIDGGGRMCDKTQIVDYLPDNMDKGVVDFLIEEWFLDEKIKANEKIFGKNIW